MTNGLVQQDSGPPGAQDYSRFASGCRHGIQLNDCLARSLFGERFRRLFVKKMLKTDSPAAPSEAPLRNAVALSREHRDAQARERLPVVRQRPFAGGYQHMPEVIDIVRLNLEDSMVVGASGPVCTLDQFSAFRQAGFRGRDHHRIKIAAVLLL